MLQPSFAFQPICTLMQRSPFKQFVANKSIRTWTENQKTKPDKCTQSNENHSWHCGCYVAASHDAAASLNALKVVLKNNKTTLGTHKVVKTVQYTELRWHQCCRDCWECDTKWSAVTFTGGFITKRVYDLRSKSKRKWHFTTFTYSI